MLTKDILSTRFRENFDTSKDEVSGIKITVVGLGSVGSYVSFMLAKMGFTNIHIYDFDDVEAINCGYQIYGESDIGKTKVQAMKDIIKNQVGFEVQGENMKVDKVDTDILVLAVDGMDTRKKIIDNSKFNFCIEARMGLNFMQVHAFNKMQKENYFKTWFPDGEADEAPCGGKAVGYTCFSVSGLVVNTVKKIINGEKVPLQQNFDLNNFNFLTAN